MSNATSPGVGWMRHLPRLNRSARVSGPEPVRLSPNAVQTERVGQATPARKMFWPLAGLGLAWTCQFRPFHRSASVLAGVRFPTAVHAVAVAQATPLRKAPRPRGAGLKVGILRVLPFGAHSQGLVTFLVYPPDDLVLVVTSSGSATDTRVARYAREARARQRTSL